MKYLKSINEGIFGRRAGKESIQKLKEPSMPKLFGDKFGIYIKSNIHNSFSNIFDNIYNSGIDEILSTDEISKYIKYYFNKMDNESIAGTLEKLSNDYNAGESHNYVNFKLNKSQLIEFMELIKKASLKLDI